MCLAIPVKVTKIEGRKATVEVEGVVREAALDLVEDVKVGDYLLLHAGFAIQKLDEKEAEITLDLWREVL
jgi:hydrogenase expression/formation protein HypC